MIHIRQRDGLDYRQASAGEPALRNEVPAPLAIAPKPEEAVRRRIRTRDISTGDEIEVSVSIEILHGDSCGGEFQDLQPGRRGFPPTMPVPKIDVGTVGLMLARVGPVDDDVGMAVFVDVTEGEGLKLVGRGVKIDWASGEATATITFIDVDPLYRCRPSSVEMPRPGPSDRRGSDPRGPRPGQAWSGPAGVREASCGASSSLFHHRSTLLSQLLHIQPGSGPDGRRR